MRIATNRNTLTNAIMKPMGTGFFVTIGRIHKFFDYIEHMEGTGEYKEKCMGFWRKIF